MEVGVAGDVPDVKREDAQARLGKGPVILIGRSMLPNLRLRDLFVETAEGSRSLQFDFLERGEPIREPFTSTAGVFRTSSWLSRPGISTVTQRSCTGTF